MPSHLSFLAAEVLVAAADEDVVVDVFRVVEEVVVDVFRVVEVVVDVFVEEVVVEVVFAVDVVLAVVVSAPGRHWLYQSFWYTQWLPETQVVAPVQPMPPHCPQVPLWATAPVAKIPAITEDFMLTTSSKG